ncbi:hypothetical protein [Rhizobium vallis]|uniref:hypothetical protein n=1 Tax=Rhizobium vallis TaxID=634290 RepID=UPI001ABFFF21|nr:hypothetical protein [Rhizobium vallis]
MSTISAQQLRAAANGAVNAGNLNSVLTAMDSYGSMFGLDLPHRAVQYYAQIMHESGDDSAPLWHSLRHARAVENKAPSCPRGESCYSCAHRQDATTRSRV